MPGVYTPKQPPCALEGELSGREPDGTSDEPSMCTTGAGRGARGDCRSSDIEFGRKHPSEEEWPGQELPCFEAPRDGNAIGAGKDEGCCHLLSVDQRHRHDHCLTGETADAEQPPRKRRKVGRPTRSMPTPPASTSTGVETDDASGLAEFEEWALQNAFLKRIMVDGVATFQLQFDWNICTAHEPRPANSKRIIPTANRSAPKKQKVGAKARFTPDEDTLLIRLKEELQLPWAEIRRRHNDQFPGRSKESLQVRYCTKLKCRNRP